MRYSTAGLFAALLVWGGMSPALACRGENSAKILELTNNVFVRTGADQYDRKVEPNVLSLLPIFSTEGNSDLGFCVILSVLDTPDLQDVTTGVYFWGAESNRTNFYYLEIRSGQYRISRQLFGKEYVLVPWTTSASIKKGLREKNEFDLRVTAAGPDIQINGAALTSIVARPSADAQVYGVAFGTSQKGPGLFHLEAPRLVKLETK